MCAPSWRGGRRGKIQRSHRPCSAPGASSLGRPRGAAAVPSAVPAEGTTPSLNIGLWLSSIVFPHAQTSHGHAGKLGCAKCVSFYQWGRHAREGESFSKRGRARAGGARRARTTFMQVALGTRAGFGKSYWAAGRGFGGFRSCLNRCGPQSWCMSPTFVVSQCGLQGFPLSLWLSEVSLWQLKHICTHVFSRGGESEWHGFPTVVSLCK